MSKNSNIVLALAKKNKGRITTKELSARGLRRELLGQLVEEGQLVREAWGIYRLPEVEPDIYFVLQHACTKAIFSYDTALSFHHLITEEVKTHISITVPQGLNISGLKKLCPNLVAHYVQPKNLELGLSEGVSPEGNPILLYNRERCICDIIKHRRQISAETYIQAVQNYFHPEKHTVPKDLRLLQSYAHSYGIESQVYHYMEFLM